MRRELVLAIAVMVCNVCGFSQQPCEPVRAIHPPLTAACLGKYGDLKGGYYLATTSINIPLYSIKVPNNLIDKCWIILYWYKNYKECERLGLG